MDQVKLEMSVYQHKTKPACYFFLGIQCFHNALRGLQVHPVAVSITRSQQYFRDLNNQYTLIMLLVYDSQCSLNTFHIEEILP